MKRFPEKIQMRKKYVTENLQGLRKGLLVIPTRTAF